MEYTHRSFVLFLLLGCFAAAGAPVAGQTSSPAQQPINYAQIIPCSALTMASASVPFDTYVIVYISSGGIVQVNSPNDPVVGIKIAPPETLHTADANPWQVSEAGTISC